MNRPAQFKYTDTITINGIEKTIKEFMNDGVLHLKKDGSITHGLTDGN